MVHARATAMDPYSHVHFTPQVRPTAVAHRKARLGQLAAASLLLAGVSLIAATPQAFAQTRDVHLRDGAQHGVPKQGSVAADPALTSGSAEVPQTPAAPPNMLDQPPVPATVEERPGSLTVQANNASLVAILHQVASSTGMHLEGVSGDERVFGSFGPGNPRDVLASLLNGTSYNVLMVGDLANGAPRELLLTQKTSGPPATNAASSPQRRPASSDEESDDDSSMDDQVGNAPPPSPGVPPQVPKTPQQLMLQMQQMQQQRNQLQPPQ